MAKSKTVDVFNVTEYDSDGEKYNADDLKRLEERNGDVVKKKLLQITRKALKRANDIDVGTSYNNQLQQDEKSTKTLHVLSEKQKNDIKKNEQDRSKYKVNKQQVDRLQMKMKNSSADNIFETSRRYISEEFLNKVLIHVPVQYKSKLIVRNRLPNLNSRRERLANNDNVRGLPNALSRIVSRLRLLDEEDFKKRYESVVAYCVLSNFSFGTTTKYLKKLCRVGLFGPDSENDETVEHPTGAALLKRYRLDRAMFKNHVHTRVVDEISYGRYINSMLKNFNRYNAPLLFVFFTGLRNVEVRQLTTIRSLDELSRAEQSISDVKRKKSPNTKRAEERLKKFTVSQTSVGNTNSVGELPQTSLLDTESETTYYIIHYIIHASVSEFYQRTRENVQR